MSLIQKIGQNTKTFQVKWRISIKKCYLCIWECLMRRVSSIFYGRFFSDLGKCRKIDSDRLNQFNLTFNRLEVDICNCLQSTIIWIVSGGIISHKISNAVKWKKLQLMLPLFATKISSLLGRRGMKLFIRYRSLNLFANMYTSVRYWFANPQKILNLEVFKLSCTHSDPLTVPAGKNKSLKGKYLYVWHIFGSGTKRWSFDQ